MSTAQERQCLDRLAGPRSTRKGPKTLHDFESGPALSIGRIHQYVLDLEAGELSPQGEVELAPECGQRGINFRRSLLMAVLISLED
jgi:hypothetical protein